MRAPFPTFHLFQDSFISFPSGNSSSRVCLFFFSSEEEGITFQAVSLVILGSSPMKYRLNNTEDINVTSPYMHTASDA